MTSNTLETLRRCIQALEACRHRLAEDVANSEALGTLSEPGTTSRAAADAIETRRELVTLCEMMISVAAAHHQELQAMKPLAWASFTAEGKIRMWAEKPAPWAQLEFVPLVVMKGIKP